MNGIISDTHNHTSASPDGETEILRLFEAGRAKGAQYICVTDHCEVCEISGKWGFDNIRASYESYISSGMKGKLLFGMELGGANADFEKSAELVSALPYDFIIGSVHNLLGMRDFYYLDYDKTDADELLERYFNEVGDIIDRGYFDSLGHLTYPLRYIVGERGRKIDMSRHMPTVRRILRKLADSGKALEVNTSGLRQKYGRCLPDEKIVAEFRALGGKMVTLGSDSHYERDVCAGIAEGQKMIKEAGFDCVTVFVGREPHFIKLD